MLVKQKVIGVFKKCKNMSTKQESVSMLPSKYGHFHRVTAATCKYCPLVVSPTVTNCCKELHLRCGKIPRSVFENFAMLEN